MDDIIKCSDCKTILKDDLDNNNRDPCPKCGSKKRTYEAFIEEKITLRDQLKMKAWHQGQRKPFMGNN